MRNIFVFTLGLLMLLLFGIPARYLYVCKIKNNCEVTPQRLQSLALMDGDKAILSGFEQLSFGVGQSIPDLLPDNVAFFDQLATWLQNNPDKNLTITGRYRSESESGISVGMFENLGLARANAMRELLVARGIDATRITIDHAASEDALLTEPVTFEVFTPRPEGYDTDGGLVKASFRFDDMTFSDANFEFNSDIFKPGSAFLTWADSVQMYFEIYDDQSLNIIGHTDNFGTIQYNEDLGLRRAQSAKDYLQEKGIQVPINVSTKGERAPVATNATPLGRQKNRRVNFVIEE